MGDENRHGDRDKNSTYLVDVDLGLPLLVPQKVEAPHTDLTEVTRMVLVEVGTVVVLTTGHTTTTGVLENEDHRSVFTDFSDSPAILLRVGQTRNSFRSFVPCGACQHDRCRQRHGRGAARKKSAISPPE